jgi:hypothetical protein
MPKRASPRGGARPPTRKQMATAKEIMDRGRIPVQEQYFPYLEGYVAFYTRDFTASLQALNRPSENDPFIVCFAGSDL